jgi:hypothetical protein
VEKGQSEINYDRQLILQYLEKRKKEEKELRAQAATARKKQRELERYELKTEPITLDNIEDWNRKAKASRKKAPVKTPAKEPSEKTSTSSDE